VCRRKHDPRFTTTRDEVPLGTTPPGLIIHDRVLCYCWYTPGADIDQLLDEQAARRRDLDEAKALSDALQRFAGDRAGLMTWVKERESRQRGSRAQVKVCVASPRIRVLHRAKRRPPVRR
jgi:hypothetical protein